MNLLRSKEATLTVLVIALIAQVPHAAYVFSHIGSQEQGMWQAFHSYSYAIALELAVLLFVVRNRQLESYGFALVSVLINICYYDMHTVAPFSFESFPAWLVSVALPVAIACYSHDIAHETVAHSFITVDSVVSPVAHSNETVAQPQQIETKPVVEVSQQKPTAMQRRSTLSEWVSQNITVNVAEVAQQFGVSQTLVRRELKELRTS